MVRAQQPAATEGGPCQRPVAVDRSAAAWQDRWPGRPMAAAGDRAFSVRIGAAGGATPRRPAERSRHAAGPGRGRGTPQHMLARLAVTWAAGTAGLLAYNWWVLAAFRPGLIRSPSELFSNLEVSGQPFAAAMQHADLAAGLLLLVAFLAAGAWSIPAGRREWLGMVIFAVAGAVGGIFPQACADDNSACRAKELAFKLPLQQYIHAAAGICEFAGITIALVFAFQRTRSRQTASARIYRDLIGAAAAAYPLLGLAYLLDRLGGVMEMIFFTGFTVVVLTQLAERTSALRKRANSPGRFRATQPGRGVPA